MDDETPIEPIRKTLLACLDALREFGAPHIIIGGVARAFLAKPRTTADVDVSVWLEDDDRIGALISTFERHRIQCRNSDAVEFARNYRLLRLIDILRAAENPENDALGQRTERT